MKMERRVALFLLTLVFGLGAAANDVVQTRRHAAAIDAKGGALFTLTEVDIPSSASDEHFILVFDEASGESWVLNRRMSYVDHVSSYEIRDLRGEVFLRLAKPLEFKGDTRAEFIAEYRENRALLSAVDPLLTLETPGGSRTARESEWEERKNARAWRSDLRRAMNPALLEAIERMRPLFDREPVSMFYKVLFELVLHGVGAADEAIRIVALPPDCEFDESFAFECTVKQKKRIADALKEKLTLREY